MTPGDEMGPVPGVEPAPEEAALPEEPAEEETLLAEPGKRNDLQWKRPDEAPYTTPRAKGKKYTPVKTDNRPMGARKRNYKSKYSEETGKNTPRSIFKGADDLNRLARGQFENLETNYEEGFKEQELKIIENDVEIQQIIENLEKKGNKGKKNDKVQT